MGSRILLRLRCFAPELWSPTTPATIPGVLIGVEGSFKRVGYIVFLDPGWF